MKANVGIVDKAIRIVVGILLIMLYLVGVVSGGLGLVLLVLAGIFILTSLISYCPIYWIFKLTTKK
jgi:Protein of unknown function (DUF2892)